MLVSRLFGKETKKIATTMCLFFMCSFVYNLLRPLKISLVVSAPGSGAEIIPYIKTWGIIPGAFLLSYFYAYLNKRFNRQQVFQTMVMTFLGFFMVFGLFLYPNSAIISLQCFDSFLIGPQASGPALVGFLSMLKYWHLSLFYILSELWGSVVISVLFWGFTNEISNIKEAKKFYGWFALVGNIAAIFSGYTGQLLTPKGSFAFLPFIKDPTLQAVSLCLLAVLFSGTLIIYLFNQLYSYYSDEGVQGPSNPTSASQARESKKKENLSLHESFRHVAQSKHLIYITLLVVGYNLVFNLTDVMWTHQLHERFGNDGLGLKCYMDKMTSIKGIVASLFALFVSTNVIRKFGWFPAALITPTVILVTSSLFFPLMLWGDSLIAMFAIETLSTSILSITVFIGAVQNCLTRASKYTVFDATKEMAFIPLDRAAQRKGKIAIDGVASRVGKSGGSIIYQLLFTFVCSSMSAAIPYISALILVFLLLWIYAIAGLNKELKEAVSKQ